MSTTTSRNGYHALFRVLPSPLQRVVARTIQRASDVEPEKRAGTSIARPFTLPIANKDAINRSLQKNTPLSTGKTSWLPILALSCAVGLFIIAYAFTNSRAGSAGTNMLFLPGLLLTFAPIAVRLLISTTTRTERIWLLCILGLIYYLVKVVSNPLYFTFFDEFLHWRTVDDMARTGHLFTENALLPVSPYYPGLEIVTNALSTVSGLSNFYAGLVVIGISRLLMVLALFALNEQLFKSARVASIATLLYMINPHFLMFDAQYGYESLALPLATLMLFVLSPHQSFTVRLTRLEPLGSLVKFSKAGQNDLSHDLRWITLTAWFTLVAVVLTHHVTDFFFDLMLVIWTIIYAAKRLTPLYRSKLALTAVIGVGVSVLSVLRPGNPVVGYLTSFMTVALVELGHILSGTGSAKQLFANYSGPPTPILERIITIASVGIIVMCLPFGLLCLWRRYRGNALAWTFGLISLLYPVSQAFRLTNTGSEVADRAAAFLFIPIASVLAIFIVQFWPVARLRWTHIALLTGVMSLVFLGGVALGTGPDSALLPGPYEVSADARSIEPEGIQAAIWSNTYLKPDNRVAADRINQILMGTYGDQQVVTTINGAVDLSSVFLSPTLDDEDKALLHQAHVHYLVADKRFTQSLPLLGFYYEEDETDAFHRTTPMSVQAFTKFDTASQVNRVFDGGDIIVYDVGGMSSAA